MLSILTYNMHFGLNLFSTKLALKNMMKALGQVPCDIYCLQEVPIDLISIKRHLTMLLPHGHYITQANSTRRQRRQGNAILSRYPITNFETFDLSIPGAERRGLLLISIQVPLPQFLHQQPLQPPQQLQQIKMHIACVHLGLMTKERIQQTLQVETRILALLQKGGPLILAGDFNDWRRNFLTSTLLSQGLKDAFVEIHQHYALTFPSLYPLLPLDRIYFGHCQLLRAELLRGPPWRGLSDHLPLKAVFNF